ncbi:MAG: phage holin family protein [Cryomorphaceae bacterium]|jgi:hypothetical protein|nr:phage holin family protein [Cryomorphaceae bacterium]
MKTFPSQIIDVTIPIKFNSAEELFQSIIPAFLYLDVANTKDLYYGNNIPADHLSKATWMNEQIEANEIIILYSDDAMTPLGTGVECTLLTNKRLLKVSGDHFNSLFFADVKQVGYTADDSNGIIDSGMSLLSKVGGMFGGKEEDKPAEILPIDGGLNLFSTINSHIQKSDAIEYFVNNNSLDFFENRVEIIYFLYYLSKHESFKQNLIGLKIDGHFKGHVDKLLKDYPESIKLAYLKNLAILIRADGEINSLEVSNLYERFYELDCTPEMRTEVTQYLTEETDVSSNFEEFKTSISSYHISDQLTIVHAVLTDFYKISKSQFGVISEHDQSIIAKYREIMHITPVNDKACEESVDYLIKLQKGEITPDEFKKRMMSISGTLAAGGIPIIVLSFAGVAGLSAAGITSGLAALGSLVAFIPGINAMVGGILVLAGLAYGIKVGIDYMSGAEEREIKNKREALIQKILMNHQEKINLLSQDMNLLTERLTNALVDVEQNSELIAKIKTRLELFENVLKNSKKKLEADQLEAKKLQEA